MNAPRRIVVSTLSFLVFTCAICTQQAAQEKTGANTAPERFAKGVRINALWSAPPANEPVVKGAPYSAEEVTERTQTLADGTHITQPSQIVRLYRDSEGRRRREWFLGPSNPSDGVMIASIIDPVSGFRYLLDSYNHIAHRFSPPEKGNQSVRYSQEAHAATPGTNGTASQAVKPPAARTDRPEASTESLGSEIIEGVSVEGQKTTRTFPVDSIGNDRPVVSVSEHWFSNELRMTVLSKTSDPRTGETTMRLRNINRSEPDPALFSVPPDYQIVDDQHDQAEIKIP